CEIPPEFLKSSSFSLQPPSRTRSSRDEPRAPRNRFAQASVADRSIRLHQWRRSRVSYQLSHSERSEAKFTTQPERVPSEVAFIHFEAARPSWLRRQKMASPARGFV